MKKLIEVKDVLKQLHLMSTQQKYWDQKQQTS
jgi:hypothetical protein